MAEAENVGYKRTKKGEKPMPNDLYDLEYAPSTLDCEKVLSSFDIEINALEASKTKLSVEKGLLEEKLKDKENEKVQKKLNRISELLETIENQLDSIRSKKLEVEGILTKYYENNKLKEEYSERDDEELINHFKHGVLYQYRSEDILLRNKTVHKILDAIRQEVIWD